MKIKIVQGKMERIEGWSNPLSGAVVRHVVSHKTGMDAVYEGLSMIGFPVTRGDDEGGAA